MQNIVMKNVFFQGKDVTGIKIALIGMCWRRKGFIFLNGKVSFLTGRKEKEVEIGNRRYLLTLIDGERMQSEEREMKFN